LIDTFRGLEKVARPEPVMAADSSVNDPRARPFPDQTTTDGRSQVDKYPQTMPGRADPVFQALDLQQVAKRCNVSKESSRDRRRKGFVVGRRSKALRDMHAIAKQVAFRALQELERRYCGNLQFKTLNDAPISWTNADILLIFLDVRLCADETMYPQELRVLMPTIVAELTMEWKKIAKLQFENDRLSENTATKQSRDLQLVRYNKLRAQLELDKEQHAKEAREFLDAQELAQATTLQTTIGTESSNEANTDDIWSMVTDFQDTRSILGSVPREQGVLHVNTKQGEESIQQSSVIKFQGVEAELKTMFNTIPIMKTDEAWEAEWATINGNLRKAIVPAMKAWMEACKGIDWQHYVKTTKECAGHPGLPNDQSIDHLTDLLSIFVGAQYRILEKNPAVGLIPIIAFCRIGRLNAESINERQFHICNQMLTKKNVHLDPYVLNMWVTLRMNKDFIEFFKKYHPMSCSTIAVSKLKQTKQAVGDMMREAEHQEKMRQAIYADDFDAFVTKHEDEAASVAKKARHQ